MPNHRVYPRIASRRRAILKNSRHALRKVLLCLFSTSGLFQIYFQKLLYHKIKSSTYLYLVHVCSNYTMPILGMHLLIIAAAIFINSVSATEERMKFCISVRILYIIF